MKNNLRIVRNLWLLGLAAPFVAAPAFAQTDNWASGDGAMINISTGDYNTAMGVNTLRLTSSGSGNSAFGRGAMYKNTSGSSNTAVGFGAMYWNTSCCNTAVGTDALGSTSSGSSNTAVGHLSLFDTTTGVGNAAVGRRSLENNTVGEFNVAMGFLAMGNNVDGNDNVAVGHGALSTSSGDFNTAVGSNALFSLGTGSHNTAVGANATPGLCSGCSNTTVLGASAIVTASNTIRIGNSSITQIGGNVGWSNVSDGRYKTNVKQNVPGLEFITKLKPVTFNWDLGKLNEGDGMEELASDPVFGEAREAKARKVFTGFIAQDVEAAARECGFDFSGVQKPANERSRYQLAYAEFVVPLVKGMQEQQKEIEALRETVKALASDSRLRDGHLGQGAGDGVSRYAGLLGDSWGGLMTLLSVVLVTLHLKRRRSA